VFLSFKYNHNVVRHFVNIFSRSGVYRLDVMTLDQYQVFRE